MKFEDSGALRYEFSKLFRHISKQVKMTMSMRAFQAKRWRPGTASVGKEGTTLEDKDDLLEKIW